MRRKLVLMVDFLPGGAVDCGATHYGPATAIARFLRAAAEHDADRTDPLTVGDRVAIKNRDGGGNPIEEGPATIRDIARYDRATGECRCLVEFDDEPGATYNRFVRPEHRLCGRKEGP